MGVRLILGARPGPIGVPCASSSPVEHSQWVCGLSGFSASPFAGPIWRKWAQRRPTFSAPETGLEVAWRQGIRPVGRARAGQAGACERPPPRRPPYWPDFQGKRTPGRCRGSPGGSFSSRMSARLMRPRALTGWACWRLRTAKPRPYRVLRCEPSGRVQHGLPARLLTMPSLSPSQQTATSRKHCWERGLRSSITTGSWGRGAWSLHTAFCPLYPR
jgi:hypothetical protein